MGGDKGGGWLMTHFHRRISFPGAGEEICAPKNPSSVQTMKL